MLGDHPIYPVLLARDLPAAREFYHDTLGLELLSDNEFVVRCGGGTQLAVTKSTSPILTLTYLPVILVSGTFGSLASQPRWLTTLIGYRPAQPMIDAAARALEHAGGPPVFAGPDLLVLAGWAVAGVAASTALFRWEPSRPAHRRTA